MLLTYIREIADEPVFLDPTATDIEARENTWSLSAPVHERRLLAAQQVVAAFEDCASTLGKQLRDNGHEGPATFYVWHDAQAGQLRCSTTSLPGTQLPFGTRVEHDAPLAMIVEDFLADAHPGQVLFEDLQDLPEGDVETRDLEDFIVRAWTTEIGGNTTATQTTIRPT